MIGACFYTLIFCAFIYYLPFFRSHSIKQIWIVGVFLLKIVAGFFLTWIYTRYYPDRQTADIYKYFDDATIMYSAFNNGAFQDYFKMLSGLFNDNNYFDFRYYQHMNHWYRHYDFGTYNDNHTIIRFNALVMFFSLGNFHIHTVFMCFVSFLGLFALYRTFVSFFTGKEKLLFVSLFLIPSVTLWSSGVLKEGILLFSLGFLFYGFFGILVWKKRILLNGILFLAAAFLLLINKNYLLLAVAPALLCFTLVRFFSIQRPILFYGIFYILIFFTAQLFSALLLEDSLLETFSFKQRDFINVAKGGVFIQNNSYFVRIDPDKKIFLDSLGNHHFKIKPGSRYTYWKNENLNDTLYEQHSTDTAQYHLVWDLPLAGSTIPISHLEPTFFSLLKTTPFALFNSLCKPGLLSAKSILEKLSAVENTCILLFLLFCVWFKKTTYDRNLFSLCLFMCLTLLLLIGYTTPVAGAIVRYKVPILPFMCMCGILLLDEQKLPFFFKKDTP